MVDWISTAEKYWILVDIVKNKNIDEFDNFVEKYGIDYDLLQKTFMWAVVNGNVELARFIIRNSAYYVICHVDPCADENYAIISAAKYGHLDMIKFLLTLPGVCASAGKNAAFRWAADIGNLPIVEYLSTIPDVDPACENNDALKTACGHGHLDIVKFICKLPCANINDRNECAIKTAAKYGHLPIVKFLSSIVDVTCDDNEPLRLAAMYGRISVVEFLISLPGVNICAQDGQVIRQAAYEGYLSIVAMLLYNISPDAINDWSIYHKRILKLIRPVIYKIAITLTDLPTPIIIEIVEQSVACAVYVPYHIKWNMVVRIKHSNSVINNPSPYTMIK